MLEATLRDRVGHLLVASGRSDVPPFMVMDVMAAAARIEAAGGHVIHMEVGQPAAPAGQHPGLTFPPARMAPKGEPAYWRRLPHPGRSWVRYVPRAPRSRSREGTVTDLVKELLP